MSTLVISPEVAESRADVRSATRSQATKDQLADLLALASESQSDCRLNITGAHITAGSAAADYLAAAMAGITADHSKACLAHIDLIVDASADGQSRNARRQQIRQQVCASHLATLIPAVAELPWAHVLTIVGAKIVTFDSAKGTADCAKLEQLAEVRRIVADCLRAPMSREALRDELAKITGRQTSAQRKAAAAQAVADRAADLASYKLVLASPDCTPEQRQSILRRFPELDPSQVNETAVTEVLAAVNNLRDSASYAELLARLIATTPEDVLAAAQLRVEELAESAE